MDIGWKTRVNKISLKLRAKDEEKSQMKGNAGGCYCKSHLLVGSFTSSPSSPALLSPSNSVCGFSCDVSFILFPLLFSPPPVLPQLKEVVAMNTLHHGDGSSEDKASLYEKMHFCGAAAESRK